MAKIMTLLGEVGQELHNMIQTTSKLEIEIKAVEDGAQMLDSKALEIEEAEKRVATLHAQRIELLEQVSQLDGRKKALEEQMKTLLNRFR